MHYTLKDHLGSWTVIYDEDGVLEQELSYDAWGPSTYWGGSFNIEFVNTVYIKP